MLAAPAEVWNGLLDSNLLEFAGVLLSILIVIGLPVWLIFRYARADRELLHRERMKSLEAGQPVDLGSSAKGQDNEGGQYRRNVFWIAFWVGAVVPLGAIWGAVAATEQAAQFGYLIVIWVNVGVISTAAVISACVLMIRTR